MAALKLRWRPAAAGAESGGSDLEKMGIGARSDKKLKFSGKQAGTRTYLRYALLVTFPAPLNFNFLPFFH